MAVGIKGLICTAFMLVFALLLTIFACTLLPNNKNAWPLLPWLFYIFVPVPLIACVRQERESLFSAESSSSFNNVGYFFIGGFAASGPAMILVQYHTGMISLGAMLMSLGSTVFLAAGALGIKTALKPAEEDSLYG